MRLRRPGRRPPPPRRAGSAPRPPRARAVRRPRTGGTGRPIPRGRRPARASRGSSYPPAPPRSLLRDRGSMVPTARERVSRRASRNPSARGNCAARRRIARDREAHEIAPRNGGVPRRTRQTKCPHGHHVAPNSGCELGQSSKNEKKRLFVKRKSGFTACRARVRCSPTWRCARRA